MRRWPSQFGRTPRAARLAVALAITCAALGCGGRRAADGTAFVIGEPVEVQGTVSIRGSSPLPMVYLERDDDGPVIINSKTIQGELRSLSGMRVLVQGDVLRSLDGNTLTIDVKRYTLLPLPSGDVPVVGVVSVENDQCVLTTRDGIRLWLRGELVGVLRGYDAAKVWVTGALGDASLPERPTGSVPFWVVGYGVLAGPGAAPD